MADKVRPIDANALRLMKVAEYAGHTIEYAWGWKACVEYCKNDAPTIEAEPVDDWISVEDRLPEPETWVLVYIEYPKPVFEMERGISKTDAVKKVFFDGKSMYNNYGNITHWQPLPKSPKKLSREESNELLYGNYEEDRKTMIGNNE